MKRALISAASISATQAEVSDTWAQQSEISFDLCLATYCSRDQYATYPFAGNAAGFKTTKVLYDPVTDVNGFIGYLPDDQSIYVAFRGSNSPENWQVDIDSVKVDYELWGDECPKCKVHRGFYEAVNSLSDTIVSEVARLHEQLPEYKIKTTGHSLGAALA